MVCRWAGQSVTARTIAQEANKLLGDGVREAYVARSVEFLADAMLIHRIMPLELLLKKQAHPPKLCLCDHFVRNAWLQETVPLDPKELVAEPVEVSTVAGHLIESTIGYYLAGIPNLDVAWFPARKDEGEVDFVLTIGTQRIPIEIKYQRGRLDAKDVANLEGFCSQKRYNAPFGLVLTQESYGEVTDKVLAIPAASFLLVR
jgi:predicted AAA+ superfamily ATPase